MREIIITYILSYIIVIVGGLVYTLLGIGEMEQFTQSIGIYLINIFYIITIIFLYFKNRHYEKKLLIKNYFLFFSFGISIAIILNMIIFLFHPINSKNSISMVLSFISSGIIGPIYEEILFRYVFYYRLRKHFSINKSIIINVLVFAIIHLSFIKIVYAFILGLFLTKIYEKEKSILAPILIHVGANSIVLLLNEFNLLIFLLSIMNFIIYVFLLFNVRKELP